METNRSLMDQLDRVKMEQMSWEKKQETLQENLFNIQKNFTAERTRYQKEIAESQSKAVSLSPLLVFYIQCDKDCGPHNCACENGCRCLHLFLQSSSHIVTSLLWFFIISVFEESTQANKHENKMVSIFLTMKVKILDSHGTMCHGFTNEEGWLFSSQFYHFWITLESIGAEVKIGASLKHNHRKQMWPS